jgi:hypothetical protein
MGDHMPALRQKYQEMGPEAFTQWLGTAAEKEWQAVNLGNGGVGRFAKDTGDFEVLREPTEAPIAMDPDKNYFVRDNGAAPAATPGAAGGFDAQVAPLLQREGGYVAKDGRSGAPANFGINQKYNPDVDVKNLTPEKAKEIYRQRYWNAIGGDQLPPAAQAAVFDAAVNQGPQRALQWWQQSGGDLAKFNQLRLQHYRSRPDYAQNGPSWERRVRETGSAAPQAGIPGFRQVQKAQPKQDDAPSGYRWSGGQLEYIPGGPADPTITSRPNAKEQRQGSIQLRKEFDQHPDVKAFQTVATQYDIVSRLGSAKPTAANDMSMIFAYMKILDPTSVVREGEFANAQNTAGIPGRVVNAYNRALNGQRLNEQQRREFIESAGRVYEANKGRYDQLVGQYRGYASELGLPETTIQPRLGVGVAKPSPTAGKGQQPAAKRPSLDSIFGK